MLFDSYPIIYKLAFLLFGSICLEMWQLSVGAGDSSEYAMDNEVDGPWYLYEQKNLKNFLLEITYVGVLCTCC